MLAVVTFFVGVCTLVAGLTYHEIKTLNKVLSLIDSGRLAFMKLFKEGTFIDEDMYRAAALRRKTINVIAFWLSIIAGISLLVFYYQYTQGVRP